jgi:hypothetical protein
MPKDVVALQQQLKAARTRIHNLTVEKNTAWRKMNEAAQGKPRRHYQGQLAQAAKGFPSRPGARHCHGRAQSAAKRRRRDLQCD